MQVLPTEQQIDSDLRLLAGKVTAVRSYSTLKSLGLIPELAARHDLKVTVGAWLDRRLATNDQEVAAAIMVRSFSPTLGKAASISSTLLGTDQDCSVQPGCCRTATKLMNLPCRM